MHNLHKCKVFANMTCEHIDVDAVPTRLTVGFAWQMQNKSISVSPAIDADVIAARHEKQTCRAAVAEGSRLARFHLGEHSHDS